MKKEYRIYIAFAWAVLLAGGCKEELDLGPLEPDMKCDRTQIPVGEKICFMDQSKGSVTRWDWTFEGGEPATSQFCSPEVVYNAPGTYSVTLRIGRGESSAERVFKELITVSYPTEIVADFEADKTNAYDTDEVSFRDLSSGFPNAWEWTFTSADGIIQTSADQNPVMKFAPGLYTVTLSVKNPVAHDVVTKKDYLNVIDHNAVAADFGVVSPLMIIEGGTVSFEDRTMGSPTGWEWTFDGADEPVSVERNPVVRYSKAGRYKVGLRACNNINSSVLEKDAYVMVLPKDGLKMWFPFNGTMQDMSPQGNIVMNEFVSDPSQWKVDLTAPSRHEYGFSAKLGGDCKTNSDNYAVLQVANPEKLPGGAETMTLVMWVKADGSVAGKMGLFNRGRPAGAITQNTADKNQSQEWARINTTSSKSEGFVRWYVNTTGQGSAAAANDTKRNLMENEWHCVVFVKEHVNGKLVIKIYVDGELTSEGAPQDVKDTYKDPFFFGCTEQFTKTKEHQINTPLNGCLDDIMMYDYPMTAEQIRNLYMIMK